MPAIKLTCIRDLKSRVNVVDVVSRVAALRKAGARYKGLCPFHQEKTPSFHVNPDKGSYKCFGCGKAGDIIDFVRETEQLSFTEAVEALGQRFGLPIEYEDGAGPTREERSLRQELFALHEWAAEHYHRLFRQRERTGDFMRAYWTEQRRFPLELADEFKIGAADAVDAGLAAGLLKQRFSAEALRQCGLFYVREGVPFGPSALKPRFRGRLMIPIRDHQGRVVAFTARQTDLTPADDPSREAKYVNSPETPIFSKSHLLFNLDRARTAVGDDGPFLMVEGQLDALRCWQVGLKAAVAPQGTAVTEAQLHLLQRYCRRLDCFFDADAAGQKAALRLLPLAIKAGLEVRFLGQGSSRKLDPDTLFLEQGAAAYEELRQSALSPMAFALRTLLPEPASASPEHKARLAESVFALIEGLESAILRTEYAQEIAAYLHLPADAVQRDLERHRQRAGPPPSPAPTAMATPRPRSITPEEELLLICLHFEELGHPLSQKLPHDWIDAAQPAGTLLNRFLAEFEQGTWPGRDHLDELLETSEEKALVASLLFDKPPIDDPTKVANEGLAHLRSRTLLPRLRQIELALATHREDSKDDAISLLRQRTDIQRQLRQPIALPVVV